VTFEWGTIVKSINWTFVFNLINFAILLFVLQRVLFKPAMAYLDRRRERIAEHMTQAEASEQEAGELFAERTKELAEARERSLRIVEDAQKRAEEIVAESKGRAKQEADRVLQDARLELEQEKERMLADLRTAYAEITVLGAERVLDREIRIEDHRKLLDQLLSEIDEQTLKV